MNIKIIAILEDIKEKEFPDYIKSKGYSCLRFSNKNRSKIKKITGFKLDYDSLGHPDFFIWDRRNRYWFCEFKSKRDLLSNSQLCWFLNHKEYPIAVAFVLSNSKRYITQHTKVKSEEEIIYQKNRKKKNNKINKIIDDYCNKYHPPTMFRYEYKKGKYSWLGGMPEALSSELRMKGLI